MELDISLVTQQNFARIHRAALVLTGNPWDADDLAQETFLVLSAQADRFAGRSSIYTWLYGILLNLDRRERRRHGTRRRKLKVLWDNEAEYKSIDSSSRDIHRSRRVEAKAFGDGSTSCRTANAMHWSCDSAKACGMTKLPLPLTVHWVL